MPEDNFLFGILNEENSVTPESQYHLAVAGGSYCNDGNPKESDDYASGKNVVLSAKVDARS